MKGRQNVAIRKGAATSHAAPGEQGLSRRRLLHTAAAGALAAGASRYSFPNNALAQNSSPLNQIFGPGGVEAGEGITLQGGMNLAMTGQGSFTGEVMSKGAQLAVEQIAAAGGPDIKLAINDHHSGEVLPSIDGVRKLISEDRISFLQTSYGAPSEALIPILQENKILTFNGGGASPKQLFQDYLWMTRMVYGYDSTPGALAWIAATYRKAKRLATIGTLENGVEALSQVAPKIWPEISGGGVIVTKEIHDVGLTDFSQIIANVQSSNADAIFTVTFGTDLGYLVRQFREAKVDIPIVGADYSQDAVKTAGASFDTYVFATDFYDVASPDPWNVEFVKAYREKYGVDPEYYGANYYEQGFIVWDLVRRVLAEGGDPNSGEALQQALIQNPIFKSLYGGTADSVGIMTFDPVAHTVSKPMGIFGVKDGKPEFLQPIPAELVPPKEKAA
jgi:ABC-type branched-subunit amino acid transport system substrate-binding protein